MKKIIISLSCTTIILVAAYLFIPLMIMNIVKDNVKNRNSEVEKIISINHISAWGEWFSEFVLVVEMNDERYRIWTNKAGDITDKETLQ